MLHEGPAALEQIATPVPEPSAAYWSPLPDPEPREECEWAKSIHDDGRRFHRH